MNPDSQYDTLFNDFPELQSDNIIFGKEVLAHFGLLFSGYALLEAALQNCYILGQLHTALLKGEIRSQDEWTARYNALEHKVFSATLGSLLRLISNGSDLTPHMSALWILKKKRDYFAHHFFREEIDKMFSDEMSLKLICRWIF